MGMASLGCQGVDQGAIACLKLVGMANKTFHGEDGISEVTLKRIPGLG